MPPLPKANEQKTFNIPQSDITTTVADIDKVSIAPIVAVGNQQDICGATSPVVIKACA